MGERKFQIYDGNTLLATDMPLDVACCLIRGYADTYFNQGLKLTIKEIMPTQEERFARHADECAAMPAT